MTTARQISEVPSLESLRKLRSEILAVVARHGASSVIGDEITPLLVPINLTATAVGFSRVYTGVHYPGDVLFGWFLGRIVAGVVRTAWPKRWY